jgi:hypothetical protein
MDDLEKRAEAYADLRAVRGEIEWGRWAEAYLAGARAERERLNQVVYEADLYKANMAELYRQVDGERNDLRSENRILADDNARLAGVLKEHRELELCPACSRARNRLERP